jgi:hypothetical protein
MTDKNEKYNFNPYAAQMYCAGMMFYGYIVAITCALTMGGIFPEVKVFLSSAVSIGLFAVIFWAILFTLMSIDLVVHGEGVKKELRRYFHIGLQWVLVSTALAALAVNYIESTALELAAILAIGVVSALLGSAVCAWAVQRLWQKGVEVTPFMQKFTYNGDESPRVNKFALLTLSYLASGWVGVVLWAQVPVINTLWPALPGAAISFLLAGQIPASLLGAPLGNLWAKWHDATGVKGVCYKLFWRKPTPPCPNG